MMTFKEFVGYIEGRLSEDQPGVWTFEQKEVEKLNDAYDALIIHHKDSPNTGISLDPMPFYEEYEGGTSLDEVYVLLAQTVDSSASSLAEQEKIGDSVKDYEIAKEHFQIRLFNKDFTNPDYVNNVPYLDRGELAISVCCVFPRSEGAATVTVTKDLMMHYGIDQDQLFTDAFENSPKNMPLKVTGITGIIKEIDPSVETPDLGVDEPLVISGESNLYGAAVLFYEDTPEKVAKLIGGDYYLIPSSVHEWIVTPDRFYPDNNPVPKIEEMIRSINIAEVLPKDRLSDRAYHYDSKEKVIELASDYIERTSRDKGSKGLSIGDDT